MALHVICASCNRDLLEEGSLAYMDKCPFKCGSNEKRHRIQLDSSGLILKTEPLSLEMENSITRTKIKDALKQCANFIQVVALSILLKLVSMGFSLIVFTVISAPGLGLVVLIGQVFMKSLPEETRP